MLQWKMSRGNSKVGASLVICMANSAFLVILLLILFLGDRLRCIIFKNNEVLD